MNVKNIFDIVKADRYTADGCKQIEDARRTYKIGEISEKTGLQKTANGWVKPKKGAPKGAKKLTRQDNTTGSDFKEGQRIPNAGAIGQTYRHRERQYLKEHSKAVEADPGRVTEKRQILADLVANSREQAQMYEAITDMSEGEGLEWEINSHVAEELNKLNQEERKLQDKLNELENPKENKSETKESITEKKTAKSSIDTAHEEKDHLDKTLEEKSMPAMAEILEDLDFESEGVKTVNGTNMETFRKDYGKVTAIVVTWQKGKTVGHSARIFNKGREETPTGVLHSMNIHGVIWK